MRLVRPADLRPGDRLLGGAGATVREIIPPLGPDDDWTGIRYRLDSTGAVLLTWLDSGVSVEVDS